QPDRSQLARSKKLPARFAWLTWMTTIVVAPTSPSTAKAMASAALRTFRFRFGLVDGQGSSAEIGSVERQNRLIGFTGIGHFDEPETTGAASIPIGHQCDLFDRAVWFEDVSQLGLSCAVGEVSNVNVLNCNSSLRKSFRIFR